MKEIFKIDAALYPMGLLAVATGLGLHVAGHAGNHHEWALWAWSHTLVSLTLWALIVQHLRTHWAWVRGLAGGLLRRKRRGTLMLGLLAFAVLVTGLALLSVRGSGSPIGLWHYRLGLLLALFTAAHAIKRFPILRRAIAGSRKGKAGKGV